MAALNPEDYIPARRVSARHLGTIRPNYANHAMDTNETPETPTTTSKSLSSGSNRRRSSPANKAMNPPGTKRSKNTVEKRLPVTRSSKNKGTMSIVKPSKVGTEAAAWVNRETPRAPLKSKSKPQPQPTNPSQNISTNITPETTVAVKRSSRGKQQKLFESLDQTSEYRGSIRTPAEESGMGQEDSSDSNMPSLSRSRSSSTSSSLSSAPTELETPPGMNSLATAGLQKTQLQETSPTLVHVAGWRTRKAKAQHDGSLSGLAIEQATTEDIDMLDDVDDVFTPVQSKKSLESELTTARRGRKRNLSLDGFVPAGPPSKVQRSSKRTGATTNLEVTPNPGPEPIRAMVTLRFTTQRSKTTLATLPSTKSDSSKGTIATEGKEIDPKLLHLSIRLSDRRPVDSKPLPRGEPQVWADSRQALCETVPYFKMPQSGCHQNDGHVYAFLFDGASRAREYMDSDVIIAQAGGSMEADKSGQMVQKKDHLMSDAQVKAVKNDIKHLNPVIIIVGNKNESAVCKMPHRYNVLGWFKPIAVWAEKTLGKGNKNWTTIKYRFERLDATKSAWHASGWDLITENEKQSAGPLTKHTCASCHGEHPMIYLIGWMCVNPDCEKFWTLLNGQEVTGGALHYNPAFLLDRTAWQNEVPPASVVPPIPDVGNAVGDNLTHINTRGICCPQCGRCSSRRLFIGWTCDNPACSYKNFPKHIPVRMPMLHAPGETLGDGPGLAKNKYDESLGIRLSVEHKHLFKVNRYTFKGIKGSFVHIVANAVINRQEGGADDMFAAMQIQPDLDLERRRFAIERQALKTENTIPQETPQPASRIQMQSDPTHHLALTFAGNSWFDDQVQMHTQAADHAEQPPTPSSATLPEAIMSTADGETLIQKQEVEDGDMMTAFSINYGMPYKFVASGASKSFTNAPWPIRACRADLNWASKTFLDPKGHEEFNEELIFAYMEGQKIEYHDDGESGLGPRIATLSLGGKAKMFLRMKLKHHVGCSKTGLFTADRPVPGGAGGEEMYKKRLAAWEELQQLKPDRQAYEARRKALPKELGLFDKRLRKADDMVTITLSHGDIVLMEGYEIQQYLEHKVVPEQCLRFAMTCRVVRPEHLKAEERPAYEVGSDEEGMSSLRRMAEKESGKVEQGLT